MNNFKHMKKDGYSFVKLWLYASIIWLSRVIMWNYHFEPTYHWNTKSDHLLCLLYSNSINFLLWDW